MKFNLGITGKGKVPNKLYTAQGQKLIATLCAGGIEMAEIPKPYLRAFQVAGALRIEGKWCFLDFPCFLEQDLKLLNEKGNKLGKALAMEIRSKAEDLAIQVKFNEICHKKYLFFLVGCVCLDWNGLKILQSANLIPNHQEQNRGKYGNYTLYANENVSGNCKELYWGSHTFKLGGFNFTTFGDHYHSRLAFPDLLFKGQRVQTLQNLFPNKNKLQRQLMHFIFLRRLLFCRYMLDAGKLLFQQKTSPKTLEHLLYKLNYINDDKLNIPVITVEDRESVNEFIKAIRQIIEAWIKENYHAWEKDFMELTPVKQGVDYKEVLIQIWHYIFGYANKHLARSGYFFDPYGKASDFPGFLPAIHQAECNLFDL